MTISNFSSDNESDKSDTSDSDFEPEKEVRILQYYLHTMSTIYIEEWCLYITFLGPFKWRNQENFAWKASEHGLDNSNLNVSFKTKQSANADHLCTQTCSLAMTEASWLTVCV